VVGLNVECGRKIKINSDAAVEIKKSRLRR